MRLLDIIVVQRNIQPLRYPYYWLKCRSLFSLLHVTNEVMLWKSQKNHGHDDFWPMDLILPSSEHVRQEKFTVFTAFKFLECTVVMVPCFINNYITLRLFRKNLLGLYLYMSKHCFKNDGLIPFSVNSELTLHPSCRCLLILICLCRTLKICSSVMFAILGISLNSCSTQCYGFE